MKKEGAANQAGENGEGYVDEFLFHVLSLCIALLRWMNPSTTKA